VYFKPDAAEGMKGEFPMREQLSGGVIYHDRGFAGIPQSEGSRSAKERVEIAVRGVGEIRDAADDALLHGPIGTASALLLK